ncbi:CRISPR-associated helicase Cas3' [Halomonas sp. PAMB 3232]|uniref:CRISPR-associated helicase Cas3' n=1 Tax=Halomonas sp. PAMB 3232 TaxID=3075221 RepID=UPI00289ADFF3|nr:CRISPR-associated helicase Cas3' [Halomonas sp. PAMB 3232]WNL38605.1 CRISPR-associated helicase Cas3' [Halomonas sp. PAMB 3232]
MSVNSFSSLSIAARSLWSKSAIEGPGHNLLAHMLDVAAVAETLLELEPQSTLDWAAHAFGLPCESCARWLAAFIGLHDFGKAIPGFAAKWPVGREIIERTGLVFSERACRQSNHSLATAALLVPPLQKRLEVELSWLRAIVQAISAHHGKHFLISERQSGKPKGESQGWFDARECLLAAYWSVLSPSGEILPRELDIVAVNWLAGLTSTADWIASNPDWFPLGERHEQLQTYYIDAKRLAALALHDIGWKKARALLEDQNGTAELLGRIRGRPTAPRPLQIQGDQLLQTAKGPALLLVEAPMGEGKTELAFLAHLRFEAANGHRGLYLALPTQATGNALFTRTQRFLKSFLTERTDIQLVHGGAAMNEQVRHLRNISHSSEETLSASAWFSQRRRPLLSPYGVGTVDQALLATLNVKHHFVRLWGLGNRVVVFDEVHAYDTYTGNLIVSLVRWLKAMNCSVVLMSATLPRKTRDQLVEAWGADSKLVPEFDYPRVIMIDDQKTKGVHCPARDLKPIELNGIHESLDVVAEKAIELIADGGCGAIVVNTVNRAQALYRMLKTLRDDAEQSLHLQDLELVLFHARFPADQRGEIETQVLDLFGENDEQRPRAALMIATQVAEQSLDISFDFMLSDLAPVDLILQRAGRLHRHQHDRPLQHEKPRLWVAGLERDRLPSLEDTAWGHVYDPYWLGRSWAFLRDETTLRLPVDIDRLVQVVYSEAQMPAGLPETISHFIEIEAYGDHLGEEAGKRQLAANVSIDIDAEPLEAYSNLPYGGDDELGLRNRTRLGADSVAVVPVEVTECGWKVGDVIIDPRCVPDDESAKALYKRQLRLGRKAVVKHCQHSELPVAFAEHPILRHLYPLPLEKGVGQLGAQAVYLDSELGLVYVDGASE